MVTRFLRHAGAAAGLCLFTTAGHAVTWNEATAGDLSNNGLAPTVLPVALGSNQVLGSVGNSGQGIDRDYFTFTVPPGATLKSLRLLSNTSISGGSSFLALQAGPQVTVTTSGGGVENLLGFTHYGNDQIGTDLLPLVVFSFNGSLPSGTYSVWVQETGGRVDYGLDLGIEADAAATADVPTLPEWAFIALAALMLGVIGMAPRRR